MDLEQRARRQSRRVIISEILMVVAVIITVIILALVVSGYWLNSDFKVERQGLLQISSIPTGASVEVDGASSWLQSTNTSKVLATGEHTVKLSKDGYDSWSRTIDIKEGLLYRIHYPRLFAENRSKEPVFTTVNNTSATVSPSRTLMLLTTNTTTWTLLNLENEKLDPRTVELPADFPFTSRTQDGAGVFNGKILSEQWARDNEHILIELAQSEEDASVKKWYLLNVKSPEYSIDLTKIFNTDFAAVSIIDHSASNLLVVSGGNLHRIDISSRQMSAVLVSNIQSFDHYDSTVVFSAPVSDMNIAEISGRALDATTPYFIGTFRLGDGNVKPLCATAAPARVAIGRFYDDVFIVSAEGSSAKIYKKADFSEFISGELSFSPEHIKVGSDGEFISLYSDGSKLATVDMEAQSISEWSPSSVAGDWLDGSMYYSVADGVLSVYDFDGLNARTLASNVSAHFPVTISADKWLYFISDGSLMREWLVEH